MNQILERSGLMMSTLLEVKDLEIEIHDNDVSESIVEQINITLHDGEILGLVGESGSGKSMTALAIAGLLRRHDMKKKGQIVYQGKNLLNCPRRELRALQGDQISMIFQEPMTSLNPVKRIGWQVEESLKLHHPEISKEERKQRAIQMLADVELPEPEKVYRQYPHELSGGMRQRVMIAAAMISNPKLLIADEPTTALDVTIQLQIVKLLQKLNQEKKTAILFISHDLSLIKKLCHKVLVMKDGRVVEEGVTEDIFYHPKEEYTKELINAIPKLEKHKEVSHE